MMEVFYMILESLLAGIGITIGITLTCEFFKGVYKWLKR